MKAIKVFDQRERTDIPAIYGAGVTSWKSIGANGTGVYLLHTKMNDTDADKTDIAVFINSGWPDGFLLYPLTNTQEDFNALTQVLIDLPEPEQARVEESTTAGAGMSEEFVLRLVAITANKEKYREASQQEKEVVIIQKDDE